MVKPVVVPTQDELDLAQYSVLIVDDAPINLGVLVQFLESYGLGIRVARSGESALRRAHYDPPDIILLDVLMPGIDGFETCLQLKANADTADIPVIFMTSLGEVEDKVRGFEVGAVDYVTKPLHHEEVLARVTTHLQLRRLTKMLQSEKQQLQVTTEQEKARLFDAVKQQREQLRTLNTRLNELKEFEYQQIARELHDELGQTLTAIQINLSAIRKDVNGHLSPKGEDRLAETETLTSQTLEQIRELSLSLRPPMLDDLGLVPTLRWYIKRFGARLDIKAGFTTSGVVTRLASEMETHLYRIVQEALTNVAKHAQARNADVKLTFLNNRIRLAIQDDGVGFDPSKLHLKSSLQNSGAGLLGIRERVHLLGGELEIKSTPNTGTLLNIEASV